MNKNIFVILFFLTCISCEDNSSSKLLIERVKTVKFGMSPKQASDIMVVEPQQVYISFDSGFNWNYGTPFLGASSPISITFSKDSIVESISWGQ